MTVKIECKPIPLLVVTLCVLGGLLCRARYSGMDKTIHSAPKEKTMHKDFATGGDILDYFSVARDAMKISWTHRVNDRKMLGIALKGNTMMLEADIRLRTQDGMPVMAHDSSDITADAIELQEWLERVAVASDKGIKLDIKSTDALQPTLMTLQNMAPYLQVPILLNADILVGPNSRNTPVNATQFFTKVQQIFPGVTLSVGWTTGFALAGENNGYSQDMVKKMYSLCQGLEQFITFPVRASLTAQSLDNLKWLVAQSNKFSLTVWHSGEEKVQVGDLLVIRGEFKRHQVYYDLPEKLMSDFQAAL